MISNNLESYLAVYMSKYFVVFDLINLVALARGSTATPNIISASRQVSSPACGRQVSSYRFASNDNEARSPDGSRLGIGVFPYLQAWLQSKAKG